MSLYIREDKFIVLGQPVNLLFHRSILKQVQRNVCHESVRIMPFGDRKEQYSVETHEGARTNQQGDMPFTLKKKKCESWLSQIDH